MRRFLGMVLFAISVPIAMTLLSKVVYLAVGWVEALATGAGAPQTYGAAIANVVLLMAVIVMTTGALLTVAERKWSAMIQNRIGPNRIRVFGNSAGGIFFLAADALKINAQIAAELDEAPVPAS